MSSSFFEAAEAPAPEGGTAHRSTTRGLSLEQHRRMRWLRLLGVVVALAILCAVFTPAARASALVVGLHLHSMHYPARGDQNNSNLGIYVRADQWVVGTYRNTLRRDSFYAARSVDFGPLSLTGGGITGYQRKGAVGHTRGAVGPFVASSAVLPPVLGTRFRIVYVPGRLVKSPDVVHLAAEWSMR